LPGKSYSLFLQKYSHLPRIKSHLLNIRLIVFAENTGYGNASGSLIKHLQKRTDIHLDIIRILGGDTSTGGLPQVDLADHCYSVDHLIIHTVPEYFPFWFRREKAIDLTTRVWGYTTWETTELPTHWPRLINALDGLFVPCEWNKQVFQRSGINIRTEVLPHISEYEGALLNSDEGLFKQTIDPDHFIFYTIGVWNERKNTSSLVRAFLNEFSCNEPVSLVVKSGTADWTNYKRRLSRYMRRSLGSSAHAMHKLLGRYPRANIHHLSEHLSAKQIGHLHQAGDCFISFTRGEGWGMGAYEAAWFGKAVAIAPFGGQVDFLTEQDTYWLKYKLVHVKTAYGSSSYTGNQQWAEVLEDAARKTMRHIYENQQEAKSKGNGLQNHVCANFAADNIISNLIQTLNA
jgi:glycosyltransferase involved in cell wall biosynthesis